jgi:probable dihydroxyacetone kinase regulator
MKHDVTTYNTKKALAAALKKQMEKKLLSKVTVSEIIKDCGVNRKTFYYHFEDIYALLKWMLEQEAIEVVKQFDLMVDYREAIIFIMDYIDENKHILNCAYDSMGRDELKRFLCNDFDEVIRSLINTAEKSEGKTLDMDFKNFVCDFYTEACAGVIIKQLRNKSIGERDKTINHLVNICKSSLPHVLSSAFSCSNG